MKKRMLSILCFMLCMVLVLPAAGATTADTSAADAIMEDVGAVNFTVMHTGDTNGIMAGDAEAIGYSTVYLDTLPFLTRAIGMYRRMGFQDIPSYNGSPMENLVYLKRALK